MQHKYHVLFTDFHSNIHHDQMRQLPDWYSHARKVLDFWAVAYYPYGMRIAEGKMAVEDLYPEAEIQADWEALRTYLGENQDPDFPVFLGYEWQGAGLDGDHNVFFKEDGRMTHPKRYSELVQNAGCDAIGIPHHLAYKKYHRGKNWDTHDAAFSPIAEVFSSHGSSESGYTDLPMHRHIHMGPRTGDTSLFNGLMQGQRIGVIASGDNHIVPGVFGNGYAAVLAKDKTRESIWEALTKRHVYGVTANKILLDYRANGHQMGDVITDHGGEIVHEVFAQAGDAISRIELIKNNVVFKTYTHNGSWEFEPLKETERFKFKIEFGWGPNTEIFKDHVKKQWSGRLKTVGKIISIENCFTAPGQDLKYSTEQEAEFTLTTYKSTQTGKWMGPSPVTLEGFIFEIEAPVSSDIELEIDGRIYNKPVREILADTDVLVLYEEAEELVKERFGLAEFYRSDPFYHNAYKVRILRGTPSAGYNAHCRFTVPVEEGDIYYMVKVYQRNGELAWSSPIFL